MIVPDASATALLFGRGDRDPRVLQAHEVMRGDTDWVAPEHWRIEVMSVLRGLTLAGKLADRRAQEAIAWLGAVTVLIAPTEHLLARIWELRANLSAYDAGYVAVAEASGVTLVTADARLARAGVARCPIRVIV